jgi:hypothetical protein
LNGGSFKNAGRLSAYSAVGSISNCPLWYDCVACTTCVCVCVYVCVCACGVGGGVTVSVRVRHKHPYCLHLNEEPSKKHRGSWLYTRAARPGNARQRGQHGNPLTAACSTLTKWLAKQAMAMLERLAERDSCASYCWTMINSFKSEDDVIEHGWPNQAHPTPCVALHSHICIHHRQPPQQAAHCMTSL